MLKNKGLPTYYADKPSFYNSSLVVISSIILLFVIFSSTLSNILLNNLPYIAPNTLFTIRNIIATSNPKIDTAEFKPPNVLNTVCHLYVAENQTIIPPNIPINDVKFFGNIKYRIQYIIHPTTANGTLSLQRVSILSLYG